MVIVLLVDYYYEVSDNWFLTVRPIKKTISASACSARDISKNVLKVPKSPKIKEDNFMFNSSVSTV